MTKLYSNIQTHETILELWSSSTKHPDSIFYFSDFKKCDFLPSDVLKYQWLQIFQWLCECASKLNFPFHARELVEFAIYAQDRLYDYLDNNSEKNA